MKTLSMFSILVLGAVAMGYPAVSDETSTLARKEYHVSVDGDDAHDGSAARPLRTISAAAELAQPGDVITVHAGVYRERVNPPRGGDSDSRRIVYQAAPGEQVEIKGSEIVKGWKRLDGDTWKATLPNTFFGEYNPCQDLVRGDWFNPRGREHHTGAVYLDGHWLTEAAKLDEVMMPAGSTPPWLRQAGREYLLNVAWLQPKNDAADNARIPAPSFVAKDGTQNAPCSEGGACIGFILSGHWVKYAGVDFRENTEVVEIRAAAAGNGGIIEIRLDAPDGELLGSCSVPNTGGWQSWTSIEAKIAPVSGVKTVCLVFKGLKPESPAVEVRLWYAEVDERSTTIWAQFKGINPNEELVEINVRRACFYPAKAGMDYITVRGFTMRHAATPWAPPTAEQVGLLGTHWSKGWIIEDNVISHSKCTGITLGKYGDQWDNTSENTAEGYVLTIERALENGWSRENIGRHIVRNNTISHCEQAGLVGSLGAVFSTITDNTIHDIHVLRLFTGAEMAGIKIHAAIDTQIARNRIFRTCRGIWLDWMAQGTRVTRNLLYENAGEDLFVEVDHGPFLVDNNVFLSDVALLDMSEGGAYVHNLMAGRLAPRPELNRETPYHPAHSTEVAGLRVIEGGDDRFHNNILVNAKGLSAYDDVALPMHMSGNVFLKGAMPSKHEADPLVQGDFEPGIQLVEDRGEVHLHIALDPAWRDEKARRLVTTERLGRASIPDLPYVNPDDSPLCIDADYFGNKRDQAKPFPGPFERPKRGEEALKIWPLAGPAAQQ